MQRIWLPLFIALFMNQPLLATDRLTQSPQWKGESFQNPTPVPEFGMGQGFSMMWKMWREKSQESVANPELPNQPLDVVAWNAPAEFRLAWLGHSSFLIELEGARFVTDPMLSRRASPVGFAGPARYTQAPITPERLPKVDAVLITHDHYDHLDEASIQALKHRVPRFVVPLGVGRILQDWGVEPQKITELDWWEAIEIKGVRVTLTPANHFSGRQLWGRNRTLWAGYALRSAQHSVFHAGDTGWHPGFAEIGQRLGPFEVGIFEMGAYNPKIPGWKEVHLTPEEAVQASQAVQAQILVPAHWGTFDLALHSWHEPIERLVKAAQKAQVRFLTPQAGETFNPGHQGADRFWWRETTAFQQRQEKP